MTVRARLATGERRTARWCSAVGSALLMAAMPAVSYGQLPPAKLVVQTDPAMPGVRIELVGAGQTRTTDSDGRASFAVAPAILEVVGTAPGGMTVRRLVTVEPLGTTTLTMAFVGIEPPRSELLVVTTPGARVVLSDGRSAEAGANGQVLFSGIIPGAYHVRASRAGYEPSGQVRLTLRSGERRTVRAELRPPAPAPAPASTSPPATADAGAPGLEVLELSDVAGAVAGSASRSPPVPAVVGAIPPGLGRLTISAPRAADVQLGTAVLGRVRPEAPLTLLLPPGRHLVLLVAEGFRPDSHFVAVHEGSSIAVRGRDPVASAPAATWRGAPPSWLVMLVLGSSTLLLLAGLVRSRWIITRSLSDQTEIVTGRFDRYLVVGTLGRGGMATVYRAREPRGELVALKIMEPSLREDRDLLTKFLREGRVLQAINQYDAEAPVVRALDFGLEDGAPDGRPYIAMEHLSGASLLTWLRARGGSVGIAEAVQVVSEIARGLSAAHACGVYHRDLTPDNVMILADTPAIALKLIDFGVARHEFTSAHTLDGSIFGKPPYMAPEQCRGAVVDGRADLYALGVLFYLLLAGHTPFSDPNPLAVMRMHEASAVPPLPPGVPEAISEIVLRLLEKDPADRFATPAELISELSQVYGAV
jgi:tRNA A-37 threonylcarbamoyl transferase component Bud32